MSKHLSIGQVASATGLSTATLRYYEQIGLLQAIGRTASGHRLYSPDDLEWLRFVMRLKATGMPVAQMQHFAVLRAKGDATYGERRVLLAAHRDAVLARIAGLQQNLAAISEKIDWYDDAQARTSRHDASLSSSSRESSSCKTPNRPVSAKAATHADGKS